MTDGRITPFLFEGEHTIREIEIDGLPKFVGKDVAAALGYRNTTDAVKTHCKHGEPLGARETRAPLDAQTILIPESDVYRLILRSKLPAAARFEVWLMEEVLPSLRRSGGYVGTPPLIEEDDTSTPDGLKLRKVNTAIRCFGERSGAQLWVKLGLEWVPAMAGALSQGDLLDSTTPPGSVTITVTPQDMRQAA